MRTTYEEIYDNMRRTFFEKCSRNVDEMGDVGLRMQAVATELFSLSCYGDYILKQAFAQTATGEYLDLHAKLRNIQRKPASKAKVELTFTMAEPVKTFTTIPFGTICACSENPYIQFKTSETARINVGESEATVKAQSIYENEEHNVDAYTIDVIVDAPSGISSVINKKKATGGFSGEDDESLRNRILKSFIVAQSGLTPLSLATVVERIDEVLECKILKNGAVLDVYVKTADNTINSELNDKIKDALMVSELLMLDVNIISCQPISVNLSASAKINSSSYDKIENQIQDIAEQSVSSNGIGNSLELEEIVHKCLKLDGLEQIRFDCPLAENGLIPVDNNQYLVLGNFEVTKYE